MSPHASKLATAFLVFLCAWLFPACADREGSIQGDLPATGEPQASQPGRTPHEEGELRVGDELAGNREQAPRAYGRAGRDRRSEVGKAKGAPAQAGAKAPDASAERTRLRDGLP